MRQPGQFKVVFTHHFQVPESHNHKTALIKGVLAFTDGKSEHDNPYWRNKSDGFREAWRRGFDAAKAGIATVEQ